MQISTQVQLLHWVNNKVFRLATVSSNPIGNFVCAKAEMNLNM